jgi:hypothetical protein
MHPTYNRGGRVQARSVGPNPTGAASAILPSQNEEAEDHCREREV